MDNRTRLNTLLLHFDFWILVCIQTLDRIGSLSHLFKCLSLSLLSSLARSTFWQIKKKPKTKNQKSLVFFEYYLPTCVPTNIHTHGSFPGLLTSLLHFSLLFDSLPHRMRILLSPMSVSTSFCFFFFMIQNHNQSIILTK